MGEADMSYRTPRSGGDALIEVKRSKFIAVLRPVSSVSEAEELLEGERKKYHDARHHCSAYIIKGSEGMTDISHSSDDGEPSGTAGKPILEVLTGAGLKNAALVVTRYFGGTLLGTGGLVRAYTDAAKGAVEAADICTMRMMQRLSVSFDYTYTQSVDRCLAGLEAVRTGAEYGEKVRYDIAVGEDRYEELVKEIEDITRSSAAVEKGGKEFSPGD